MMMNLVVGGILGKGSEMGGNRKKFVLGWKILERKEERRQIVYQQPIIIKNKQIPIPTSLFLFDMIIPPNLFLITPKITKSYPIYYLIKKKPYYISKNPKKMFPKKSMNISQYSPNFHCRKINTSRTNYKKKQSSIREKTQYIYKDQLGGEQKNLIQGEKQISQEKEKKDVDKELITAINQQIRNSKPYQNLKKVYQSIKNQNTKQKKQLNQRIDKIKQEKSVLLKQNKILKLERQKYQAEMKAIKNKIVAAREINVQISQELNMRVLGENSALSSLLMALTFHQQYQHGINPDRMTYQQLLQLGEKIGEVSRGLPPELISKLPKIKISKPYNEKCTICCSLFEVGDTMTKIRNCQHEFHLECLKPWLKKQKNCPLCKKQVEFQSK